MAAWLREKIVVALDLDDEINGLELGTPEEHQVGIYPSRLDVVQRAFMAHIHTKSFICGNRTPEYALVALREVASVVTPFTRSAESFCTALQKLKPDGRYPRLDLDSLFGVLQEMVPPSQLTAGDVALRVIVVYSRSSVVPKCTPEDGVASTFLNPACPNFALDGLFLHNPVSTSPEVPAIVDFFWGLGQRCSLPPYWFETSAAPDRVHMAAAYWLANVGQRLQATNLWKPASLAALTIK
jgi:hypothetical protein